MRRRYCPSPKQQELRPTKIENLILTSSSRLMEEHALGLPSLLFGSRSLFQVFSCFRMKRQIASPTGQQNMEGSRGLYLMHEVYIVPKEAAHNSHPLRME
jgi:hypothetical protein